MKRWLRSSHFAVGGKLSSSGYTIVETLIVLAVTTAMFSAIIITFSGRQAKVEFAQSVKDYEATLQNIVSEVNKGFYQAYEGRPCDIDPGTGRARVNTLEPPGSAITGTGGNCVFLAKTITPSPDGRSTRVGMLLGDNISIEDSSLLHDGIISQATSSTMPTHIPNTEVRNHSFRLRIVKIVSINENNDSANPYPLVSRVDIYGGNYFNSSTTINKSAISMGVDSSDNRMPGGFVFCLEGIDRQKAEITLSSFIGDDSISSVLNTNPRPGVDPCG